MSRKFLFLAVVGVLALLAGTAAIECHDRPNHVAPVATPEESAAMHAMNMASAEAVAAEAAAAEAAASEPE